MVEEIVETRVQFWTHQEQAAINGGKHDKLRETADQISLEKIEVSFFEKSKEDHAEQIFKNADRRKNMEEAILGIVTVEPEVIGEAKESGPQNTWNKERSKKHPKCTVTLLKKPTAKPGGHRIAHEKASKRP